MVAGIINLILLNLIAIGIGLPLVRRMLRCDEVRPECLFASIGLGMGLVGTLVLFMGLVGGLYAWVAWALMVLLLTAALPGLRTLLREGTVPSPPPLGVVGWGMLFFISTHAAMNFMVALTPPTEADTLIYHLSLPKQYVAAHGIYFIRESYFATMGYLMECLYTLGLLLGSDRLPALLQFEFGLLTAALAGVCARRWFSMKDALVPAAIFYCMPITAVSSTSAMVEMAVVFLSLLALFFAIEFLRPGRQRALMLAGLLSGCACATKLLGFLTLIALALVVLAGSRLMLRRDKRSVADAALLTALGLAVASPWLIRNLVWCGNPFFPELYRLFGASHWNNYSHRVVAEIHRGYAGRYAGRPFLGLFTVLWRLTNFTESGRSISSSIGPLYVALLPFCISSTLRHSAARLLLVFAALYYIMWYYTAPYVDLHHLMPALPALALIGAAGLCGSAFWRGWLKALSAGLVVVALLHSLAVTAVYSAKFAPYVCGKMTRDELLRRTTWYYDDILWMNRHLKENDNVAMAVAPTYYLDIPHIHLAPYREGWIDFSKSLQPDDLARMLRAKGVTHIYVVMNNLEEEMGRSLPTMGPYVNAMRRFLKPPYVSRVHINPLARRGSRKPTWALGPLRLWETHVYRLTPSRRDKQRTEAQ